jgi:hypothetical protein
LAPSASLAFPLVAARSGVWWLLWSSRWRMGAELAAVRGCCGGARARSPRRRVAPAVAHNARLQRRRPCVEPAVACGAPAAARSGSISH